MAPRIAFPILATVLVIAFGAVVFLLTESGSPISSPTAASPNEWGTPPRNVDVEPVQQPVGGSERALAGPDAPEQPAASTEDDSESARPELRAIVLTGTVRDPQGSSLGREVDGLSLTNDSGAVRRASCEMGSYFFEAIEPGEYVLWCFARGYQPAERRITLRSEESVHHEDFVLEPSWMITVRIVTAEGEDLRSLLYEQRIAPLLQLSVIATREAPGERLPTSFALERTQESLGRSRNFWAAGEQRDDRIEILSDPPVHVSVVLRDIVLATQRVDVPVEEITFVIDLDRIRGLLSGLVLRVTDADTGAPATDAWVMLLTSQSVEAAIHPDADGLVSYESRVPGLYEVQVNSKEHAPQLRSVALLPGHVADLGTISLHKGFALRGRCLDVEGHPRKVEGTLEPREIDTRWSDLGPAVVFQLPVKEDGSFHIPRLMPARYVVLVRSESPSEPTESDGSWIAAPVLVDLREGPVKDLAIVLHRPVLLLLRPVGMEAAGLEVDVITPDGLSCWESEFSSAAPQRLELAPGTYTLRIFRDRRVIREQPFTLGSIPLTLDITP